MVKRRTILDPATFQTFGDLLRYLRERANLSQRELAQQVGYHYSFMSRLEKNVRTPDALILQTRFVPALRLENEPEWATRLLELAIANDDDKNNSAAIHVAEKEPANRAVRSAGIPVSLTPLLGRESESAALFQILSNEEVRLVTLIGPPGVGKTRLALHIAEQLTPNFSDGAIFVDLMPILDAEQVIPLLAAALGAQETTDASVFESVKSALHGRSLLIVMDNFEQVLDAAPKLIPLLGAAPDVKILSTSREALRLRGEQEFPLAPLAVPNEKNQSVLDFPSVQLFLQRARSAKPDFQLDEENASRVAEICRRLDGLPLAIELAAARIRTFSPADMLEQFDRRFQWLAHTGRDIPEWRKTLWSAIAWSYNLLTKNEQTLFARLSVFAGGWTFEFAEAVCSDETLCPRSEILNMLMQLVDKSLVVAEAGPRYRFLDTISKFAREKLEDSGELEQVSKRHLIHFADWAESLESKFNTITPRTFQAQTGLEQNNIRAALDWALHHREGFQDGLRLSIPASLIWLEHGQIREEFERSLIFLREAGDPEFRPLYARLLLRTSALALRVGQLELPRKYARQAESIARELNDKNLLARALRSVGDLHMQWRDFESALQSLLESASLHRELNQTLELGHSLTSLGYCHHARGNPTEAEAALEEALEIATRMRDPYGFVLASNARAANLRDEGKYPEALAEFQRGLEVVQASGDRPNMAVILTNQSILSNLLRDYPASGKYAAEAISVFQSLGDEDQQAFPKRMLSYALLYQGLPARARAYALESLHANLTLGSVQGMGALSSMVALTNILLSEGRLKAVAQLYGFLKHRVANSYIIASPDTRAFERIVHALADADTEAWQAEGESMTLEQAIALASRRQSQAMERPRRKRMQRKSQK